MNRTHVLLATIALAAGVLSAFAREPVPAPAADEVSALQLAEWIRARRPGVQVIDLRPAPDIADGHLPGARPAHAVDVAALAEPATVVIVAAGDVDATIADALRRQWKRPDLLRLHGGMAAWNADVMFPVIRADAPARQRDAFAARARLSRYFGGAPRVLDAGATPALHRSRQGC